MKNINFERELIVLNFWNDHKKEQMVVLSTSVEQTYPKIKGQSQYVVELKIIRDVL